MTLRVMKKYSRSDLDLSKWDKWDVIDFIGEIDFTKWDSAPLPKSRKINNINDVPLVPLRKLIYGRNFFCVMSALRQAKYRRRRDAGLVTISLDVAAELLATAPLNPGRRP